MRLPQNASALSSKQLCLPFNSFSTAFSTCTFTALALCQSSFTSLQLIHVQQDCQNRISQNDRSRLYGQMLLQTLLVSAGTFCTVWHCVYIAKKAKRKHRFQEEKITDWPYSFLTFDLLTTDLMNVTWVFLYKVFQKQSFTAVSVILLSNEIKDGKALRRKQIHTCRHAHIFGGNNLFISQVLSSPFLAASQLTVVKANS